MPKAKRTDADNNYVPKDYQDLYLYYILGAKPNGDSLAKMLLRHFMPYATEDERETLLHDIFVRCLEKDVLALYNPEKSNFGGVIFFVTRSICSNHLDRKGRNPLTGRNAGTIVKDMDEETFEPGMYSLDDLFQRETPNLEAKMDAESHVAKLRTYAEERFKNPQNKRDESLLPLLGYLLMEEDPKEIAPKLGVTPSTIYNWIAHLRQVGKELIPGIS